MYQNTIVKAVKPSQETVVVYPDGTIAKDILPKIKEGIDDFIEKVMLLMLTLKTFVVCNFWHILSALLVLEPPKTVGLAYLHKNL